MPRLRPAPAAAAPEPQEPVREIIPHPDEIINVAPPEPKKPVVEQKVNKEAPKVEEPQEDDVLALKKQIEELKKSEELQRTAAERFRKEREDAAKLVSERNTELVKFQKELQENQKLAVNNALTAAKTAAEKAEGDILAAEESGDIKAKIEAYRRLARAESDVAKLEAGVEELTQREKVLEEQTKAAPQTEQTQYPEIAVKWMEAHPDYARGSKNLRLQAAFAQGVEEGYAPYTQAHIHRIEEILELRKPQAEPKVEEPMDETDDTNEGGKSSFVSAPVSRQAPNSSGSRTPSQVRLTKDQREAAAMAGISETEYAKQLVTLQKMKNDGLYGGQP